MRHEIEVQIVTEKNMSNKRMPLVNIFMQNRPPEKSGQIFHNQRKLSCSFSSWIPYKFLSLEAAAATVYTAFTVAKWQWIFEKKTRLHCCSGIRGEIANAFALCTLSAKFTRIHTDTHKHTHLHCIFSSTAHSPLWVGFWLRCKFTIFFSLYFATFGFYVQISLHCTAFFQSYNWEWAQFNWE